MQIFLKLRAWQMFILIISPMIFLMFLIKGAESIKWFGAISSVWMFVLVGWMYSVGSFFNSKLPSNLKKIYLFIEQDM